MKRKNNKRRQSPSQKGKLFPKMEETAGAYRARSAMVPFRCFLMLILQPVLRDLPGGTSFCPVWHMHC